ncbi:sperm-associated antigen 6 isoform X3 [Cephus cinctus]|uniref:Sperm-associated antigen 6 isoform X3 n=1 Tax=Cephus cinctus TaxID=211228 RepID=A0AAJ7CCJ7_CEPCN|nr:sperm-associated antigen 6 isoform X3 [Cephus cinctus]
MTARTIVQVFDQYQKARMSFVQTVADLASRTHNVECLENAGALDLLRLLLADTVPSIQQMSAIALGRLASFNEKIAQALVRREIIPQLLRGIDKQNKFYKKAALFVLRAIAKHTPEMASAVVHSGGLEASIICLEDFDMGVKEVAALCLGHIAKHNKSLAQAIVDAGAVSLLILCLQEPELCLKQVSASVLCDISKHSLELAQTVVDAGAVSVLGKYISNPDAKLKLAQLVVNTGGIGGLIDLIGTSKSSPKLPAIMALGYIAGQSNQLAIAIIGSAGVIQLALLLQEEKEDHIRAVIVWALGQIGKHTPEHAKALAVANIFPKLIELYTNPKCDEDLKAKCKATLKQVLQKCIHVEALEPLLHDAPPDILKYVVGQYSKILPNDARIRRLFVTTGGLRKVQEIQTELGSTLSEYISVINCCFPEEIVRYYSPGYPDSLLEAVEQYQPKCPSLLGVEQRGSELSTNLTDSSCSLNEYE